MLRPHVLVSIAVGLTAVLSACAPTPEPAAESTSASSSVAEPAPSASATGGATASPSASPSPSTPSDPAEGLELTSMVTVPGGPDSDVLTWSPDGRRVAYVNAGVDGSYLTITDRAGGVTVVPEDVQWIPYSAWSPDGRTLAVVASKEDGTDEVWVVDVLTGDYARCASASFGTGLGWDSSSTHVIASLSAADVSDVEPLEDTSTVRIIARDECRPMEADAPTMTVMAEGFSATVSPDGSTVAYAFIDDSRALGYATMPTAGESATVLVNPVPRTSDRGLFWDAVQPDWSPSGDRLAVVIPATSTAQRTVSTMNATGEDTTDVAADAGANSPLWSPDGEWIAYEVASPRGVGLDVIPAVGGEPRNLTFNHDTLGTPEWSPDSSGLKVLQWSTDEWTTYGLSEETVSVEGGQAPPLEGSICATFAVAEDGAMLCVMGDDTFSGVTLVPPR